MTRSCIISTSICLRLQSFQTSLMRLCLRALLLMLGWSVATIQFVAADAESCSEVASQSATDSFQFKPSTEHKALEKKISANAVVGDIRVVRHNVFDEDNPDENNRLYRWANRLHKVTQNSVVTNRLLFTSGERYQSTLLKESERILRELSFIYDAEVRPYRICGERVDVEVVTRDTWTFFPTLSLSRSGGSNSSEFGIRDSNILGSGKAMAIRRESDDERTGYTIQYRDPAIFGSWYRASLVYSENDDGELKRITLGRPFYSLDTQWSVGLRYHDETREEALYFRSDEVAEFEHSLEDNALFAGLSRGRDGDKVRRWLFGYNEEKHAFARSDTRYQPDELPGDRELSYPWVGFESVEDKFRTAVNFNSLQRTEDLYIGESWNLRMGMADDSIAGDRNQLVLSGHYSNTHRADDDHLLTTRFDLNGQWDRDISDWENLRVSTEARYHYRQSEKWLLFGKLRLDYANNLTAEQQLTLGGDNGLRGYEKKYQTGDRGFLFSLEQRYYSDWHLYNLVRVGGAAFFDVGRVWFSGQDNGSNGDVLANLGLGLRFVSSRAEVGSVLHIDFALPMMKDDDVDSLQILVTVSDTF